MVPPQRCERGESGAWEKKEKKESGNEHVLSFLSFVCVRAVPLCCRTGKSEWKKERETEPDFLLDVGKGGLHVLLVLEQEVPVDLGTRKEGLSGKREKRKERRAEGNEMLFLWDGAANSPPPPRHDGTARSGIPHRLASWAGER